MYIYDVLLRKESNGYSVEISDFCITLTIEGSRREAITSTVEHLKVLIQSNLSLGHEVPEPKEVICTDPNTELVVLAIEVAPPFEGLITVEEAMLILDVSQSRIAHLLRDGRLKAIPHGRRKLITKESLEAYMKTPRTPGRPKKEYHYAAVDFDSKTERKL